MRWLRDQPWLMRWVLQTRERVGTGWGKPGGDPCYGENFGTDQVGKTPAIRSPPWTNPDAGWGWGFCKRPLPERELLTWEVESP